MYVCMYVCVYVCMYVCMYVCNITMYIKIIILIYSLRIRNSFLCRNKCRYVAALCRKLHRIIIIGANWRGIAFLVADAVFSDKT